MQNNFQIVAASITDRGLSEKRPENEDSFLELKESGIFAVADGVGGAQAGDVASQMAMEIIGEAFVNLASPADAEEVMRAAIERANEAIFQMSNELPQLSTMATTVVALHIHGNIATIGHVGDSRLYRIDANGTLFRETQDHSVVEEEVRAGRMTPEQAANHPSRNIISRALGAEPSVEVDLKTIMFEPNTTFLICSDGITRHITDEELNALLFSSHHPAEICRRMKEICYERGAEDNLTAVVVKVLEAGAAVPVADFEQETVATARRPMAATAAFADSGSFEAPTAPLDDSDFETQEIRAADNPAAVPAAQPKVETTDFIPAPEGYSETADASPETSKGVISYDEERKGSGFFGKLVGSLALLLLGAVLGAAAYRYLIYQPVEETPLPVAEKPDEEPPPAPELEILSFEKLRREVDVDPAQYLKSNPKPEDAVDFYLTGRAHLLLKNYPEARNNFIEAKNRLANAEKENARVLATEIALGLAVINGQFSIREFEKELPPPAPAGETNTNDAEGNDAPQQSTTGGVDGGDLPQ
jgi:serine/threonine protein phosphatase PrpC